MLWEAELAGRRHPRGHKDNLPQTATGFSEGGVERVASLEGTEAGYAWLSPWRTTRATTLAAPEPASTVSVHGLRGPSQGPGLRQAKKP